MISIEKKWNFLSVNTSLQLSFKYSTTPAPSYIIFISAKSIDIINIFNGKFEQEEVKIPAITCFKRSYYAFCAKINFFHVLSIMFMSGRLHVYLKEI